MEHKDAVGRVENVCIGNFINSMGMTCPFKHWLGIILRIGFLHATLLKLWNVEINSIDIGSVHG